MRIGSVDLYKFFFSWMICFYHFYGAVKPNAHFPMGAVVVELFVLISGVFFYMGWERAKKKSFAKGMMHLSPYPYLKRRFMRFLPYVMTGVALAAGVRAWLFSQQGNLIDWKQRLTWFSEDIWEVLMINMNGINDNTPLLNVPAWTISAMLIAEFLVFALLINWEKVFTTLICPCVILYSYGFWQHIPRARHEVWIGYTTFGMLRVFALICLSWYCWQLIKKMRATQFTKAGSFLLGVGELALYAVAVILIMNFDSRNFRWVVTLLFFFAVAISISGASFTAKIFPASKLTRWLGELSMGIYLTHYPIMRIFKHRWPVAEEMFKQKYVFLREVLIASILFCVACRLLALVSSFALRGLKKITVKEGKKTA